MIIDPSICPETADIFEKEREPLLASCPDVIRDTAAELIGSFNEAPAPVVAAMLCIAAAAVGNRFRLSTGNGQNVSAGFSVVIGHNQPRALDWVDSVAWPLVFRVFTMEAALYRKAYAGIGKELKAQEQELEQAKKTENPDPELLAQAQLGLARLKAHLAPSCILHRFSVERIAEQIGGAFDQGLLSIGGGSDPLNDYCQSTPAERRELSRLLNLGWAGRPLYLKGRTVPGAVTLMWATPKSNLEKATDWRDLRAGSLPAPILYLLSASAPRGSFSLSPSEQWHRMINQCLDLRCLAEQNKVYAFSEKARSLIAAWDNALVVKIQAIHPNLAKHLAWLPMLARRVSLLLELLSNLTAEMIGEPAARASLAIVDALGKSHLQTLLEILPPSEIGLTDATDKPDASAVMLGKIRDRGVISRRELRRTYDNQRTGWFDQTLEGLIEAGKVQGDDEALSVVPESGSEDSGSASILA